MTRFVPIYREQRDYNKMFGAIIMIVGTTMSLGLTLILLVYGSEGLIVSYFVNDREALPLLLILIALAPVQALDTVLVSLLTIFASASAVFFRKYLLTPTIQLSVVLLLLLNRGDMQFLAVCYLGAGIFGVTICALTLFRVLRDEAMRRHFSLRTIKFPVRDIFCFTLPLLASDLVLVLRSSLAVIMLKHYCGSVEVAAFRAVLPIAGLNLIVFESFMFLFTPLAARLFGRNDWPGINTLYWQSSVWIAILSFPIFAVTFSLAKPLTILLYGTRYEQSALILAMISFGQYFNAALGFNGMTLRVFGKVGYILGVDLLGAAIIFALNILLIPRYGAVGAAVGTCSTLIIQNILYQAGLRSATGIKQFEMRRVMVYISIALSALGLLLIQMITPFNFYTNFTLAILVSLLVVWINRTSLNIGQMFPELLRFPLARRFV
jgi:O-antigen/teichoic acid export membrane protein